jgi:hypothetical protein
MAQWEFNAKCAPKLLIAQRYTLASNSEQPLIGSENKLDFDSAVFAPACANEMPMKRMHQTRTNALKRHQFCLILQALRDHLTRS